MPVNERSFLSGAFTVKSTSDGYYTLAGYGVRFGTLDLTGEMFTKNTDLGLARSPHGMPVLWEHGQDPEIKNDPIGTVADVQIDDMGAWFELQIDRAHKYADRIRALADRGVLGLSTATTPHLAKRIPPEITAWPLSEVSLTIEPAEPNTVGTHATKGARIMPGQQQPENQQHEPASSPPAQHEPASSPPAQHEPSTSPASSKSSDHQDISDRLAAIEGMLTAPAPTGRKGAALVYPGDTSDPHAEVKERYHKSFEAWARGDRQSIKDEEKAYKKALEIGTPSEGGYLIPEGYHPEIVRGLNDMAILRAAGARVVSISQVKSYKVPTLSDSSAATLIDEEAAYTEADPGFGQVDFTPYKYQRLTKASEEFVEDNPFGDVMTFLSADWQQAFAAAENTATATGNGSSEPQGIIDGATNTTDTAASGAFAPEDIITLYHELDHNYRMRPSCVWLMNDSTARVIRNMREAVYDGTATTTGGAFLWQPSMQEGEPDRLLGKPVITFNGMSGLTGAGSQTAGTRFLAIVDLSYYWIVDFGQMYMQRLIELYAGNGQVGFRAYRRMDANIMLQEAVQVMTIKS